MIPAHLQNRTLEQLKETQETIRCFLVQLTDEGYESIIRCEDGQCIAGFDYHRTEKIIRRFKLDPNGKYPEGWPSDEEKQKCAPAYCTRCGNFDFTPAASLSSGKGRVWERQDTGERADNLNAFGPGAMWYLTWYLNEETGLYWTQGFDQSKEPSLCVRTPGGEWVIDSRASNCSKPGDNNHRCWPRKGEPPLVTVDKSYGPTCDAGSGSIVSGTYHGFLRGGYLVKC